MVVTDYNEQFLDKRGTDHLIEELKAYINGISTGDIDLSDYVTKAELQAKLDALDINIDLSPYATKEELTQAINSIDLSSYATKSEIPSLDGYAKLTVLPTKVSQLENDSNYLTSVPEEYVTETELNAKGYLTEHQDLSSYATKSEIPSLDGYATTEYVDNAIANVPSGGTVDLSNYYTKEETDALIPTVTDGKDGISPTITENADNSDTVYKLDITDATGTFTTPNLKGAAAASGSGDSGTSSTGSNDFPLNTEVVIGTYMNKPLYRKMIELGEIKVGTHTIAKSTFTSENIGIVKIGGQLINVYSEKMNLPFFESTSSYASAYLTDYDANIKIISKVSSAHGSAWAYGYLYIEYTKISDATIS